MKFLTSVSFFVMLIFISNSWAVEPVDEQQALLYYQIPFGGVKKVDNDHKFGFRVDRVSLDRTTGQYSNSVSFNDLMKKPASLNVQMGRQGIKAFDMHGYDYLPYLISQADEEADKNGKQDDEGNGETSGDAEKSEEKKLLKYSEVLDQTTVGILIGGVIGVLAITGSGG